MADYKQENTDTKKAVLNINYYTDPLCCWSWAFEPQLRKLRFEYQDNLQWNNRMVGMLPDWKSYSDTVNDVHRPIQMGPLWAEAKYISGMPFNVKTWVEQAPKSSYPACMAVKTAELQTTHAGERMLRELREAVMIHARDISNKDILLELGNKLSATIDGFDFQQYKMDLLQKKAMQHFKKDMQDVKLKNIDRYPSITIETPGKRGIKITGYRPYEELESAFKQMLPEGFKKEKRDLSDYQRFWKNSLQRELDEMENVEV